MIMDVRHIEELKKAQKEFQWGAYYMMLMGINIAVSLISFLESNLGLGIGAAVIAVLMGLAGLHEIRSGRDYLRTVAR